MDSELGDGERLSVSESFGKEVSGGVLTGIRRSSYTESFEEACPVMMAMGMSYDEFWNGDCGAVKMYRRADALRQKRKDHELWLQGMYVYEAVADLAPVLRAFSKAKAQPYPEKPYSAKEEERVRERDEHAAEDANFFAYMSAMMAHTNARFREEGKTGGEEDGR